MNGHLKYNKKGFIQDIGYAIVMIFAIAIIILVVNKMFHQIEPSINDSDFNNSEVAQHFYDAKERFVPLTDSVALILLIGFALTAILLVVFLDSHPAFFWITLLILIFIAVIGGLLANAYQTIATNSTLADSASDFTIIPFIFEHYVQIVVGMGGLVLAALFIKGRSNAP